MGIKRISGSNSKMRRLYVFIPLNVFYSKNISEGVEAGKVWKILRWIADKTFII